MPRTLQGILAVLGRVLLCTIFSTAAVGNKIPALCRWLNILINCRPARS